MKMGSWSQSTAHVAASTHWLHHHPCVPATPSPSQLMPPQVPVVGTVSLNHIFASLVATQNGTWHCTHTLLLGVQALQEMLHKQLRGAVLGQERHHVIGQSVRKIDYCPSPAFGHTFDHQLGPMGTSSWEIHKWEPPCWRLSSPPRRSRLNECLVAFTVTDLDDVGAVHVIISGMMIKQSVVFDILIVTIVRDGYWRLLMWDCCLHLVEWRSSSYYVTGWKLCDLLLETHHLRLPSPCSSTTHGRA